MHQLIFLAEYVKAMEGWVMWSYVFLILIVLLVSMVFENTEHEFLKALTMYVLIAGLMVAMMWCDSEYDD